MFKKRISIFAILFSVFLMMVLSSVAIRNEIDINRNKQKKAERLADSIDTGTKIPYHWPSICALKKNSFFSIKKIIDKVVRTADFRSHEVMYFPKSKEYAIWNYWDSVGRDPQEEFRIATTYEAFKYYKNNMFTLVNILSGFDLWYYLAKFLIVFGISGIPSLLAFLSSLFAVSFPITVPITAIVLLFFTMVQGYADDTTIVKLMTNGTGGEHSLTLGMLHLADKAGALIILPQKGVWGAYGPVWKFSKGMAFFPIGIICGKGENGARVEYVSLWSISSVNIGKLNHVLMGSYNHSLVKNRSPFASVKETLYHTASKLQLGVRIDYLFQKAKKWKTKISIGPTLKFVKKNFGFHIHASITKPHTIRTEWELAF
jgi:hypothetical protein